MNTTSDLNHLRIRRDRLALESSVSNNLGKLFRDVFPDMGGTLRGLVKSFIGGDSKAVQLTGEQRDFIRKMNNFSYLDASPIGAFVPEGLKSTYLEYTDVLAPAAEHCKHVLSTVLAEYVAYLSALLSGDDTARSTFSHMPNYRSWERERNQLNKALGQCFSGSTSTNTTIGKVVRRNSDWPMVFRDVDALVVKINTISRKDLNQLSETAGELIDMLIKKGERGELDGMTPQVMENLGEGVYCVARELEFYSAIFYKIEALSVAVRQTTDRFVEIYKDGPVVNK